MLNKSYCFVDIETTGSSPTRDRVIEVAVIKIENNKKTKVWSSLINPERFIPTFISNYTGINQDMVYRAPTFREVASKLIEILEGSIFVAHNVSFDYGFLKNEFLRSGYEFNFQRLCTVKLSRALFPVYKKHSLDAIIERFDLGCDARHRAMGDTEVLEQFWKLIQRNFSQDKVETAIKKQISEVKAPTNELKQVIQSLDDTPGVYIFYGEDKGCPIYIGKSVNLRSRVSSHFSSDFKTSKSLKISKMTKHIEIINTAGDLSSQLLEARMIKEKKPIYNRMLRKNRKMSTIALEKDKFGAFNIRKLGANELDLKDFSNYYGVFRNHQSIEDFLIHTAKEHELCDIKLGLESPSNSCFGYKLGRCRGVCTNDEDPYLFNLRLEKALEKEKLQRWPFDGVAGIKESSVLNKLTEIHLFNNWCYLGTAKSEDEVYEITQNSKELMFDFDIYKITKKFLGKRGVEIIKVI